MADPNCPQCRGEGWKIVERDGMSGAIRCECVSVGRSEGLLEKARIPANYEETTLDSFLVPQDNPTAKTGLAKVLIDVKRYVREYPKPPLGLLLVGEPGTGKTHLAVGVMKALMEKGHECIFFDYKNLLDRIRSGY